MKIAVLGGAGYIASHTIIELYKAGHTVVAVDARNHCAVFRRLSGKKSRS